jgi:CMP-N,N'-diacetyllegionaminic acid synthase
MYKSVQRAVALIPARNGSKGLPGKNIRPIAGVPLYRRTVNQAREAGLSTVILTTDIPSILELPPEPGLVIHRRPASLAGDEINMSSVVADALKRDEFDGDIVVALLQPTSPLRWPKQIAEAITAYQATSADLVMSVCEADNSVLKHGTMLEKKFTPLRSSRETFSNRQQLPKVYRPNGAIFVFGAEWFRSNQGFASAEIEGFIMPENESIDIDDLNSFESCAQIVMAREANECTEGA